MRIVRLFAVVALLGALVAGCGSGSSDNGLAGLDADAVLTRVVDAVGKQSSVHLTGATEADGAAFEMDLKVAKGKGGSGTIKLDEGTIQVVSDGTNVYLKADKAFWTAQADAKTAALVADRWVNTGPDAGGFADILDYDAFIAEVLEPEGAITKGETKTIDGRKALALVSSEGTMWVSLTGEPLPVRIDSDGNSARFTEWGKSVPAAVPAAGDVVDLSKLAG